MVATWPCRQLEMDSSRVNDPVHVKQTNKPQNQLAWLGGRSWEEGQTFCPGWYWEPGNRWGSAKCCLRWEERLRASWVAFQISLQWVTWAWTEKMWLKAIGSHDMCHSWSWWGSYENTLPKKRGPGSGMMGRDEANGWSPDSGWLFPWTIGLRMITRSESGGSTKRLTKKPA